MKLNYINLYFNALNMCNKNVAFKYELGLFSIIDYN